MPGYGYLCSLAICLCRLHSQELSLSESQVKELKTLYDKLYECDRQRVVYKKRHMDKLVAGSWKSQKAGTVPGAESMAR